MRSGFGRSQRDLLSGAFRLRWRVAMAALLGACLLTVTAGKPGLRVLAEAEIGIAPLAPWQGWYVEGRWMPLWVELEGAGRDRSVELRVTTARASFATEAELPANGRKRLPLLVWLDASDRASGALELQVLDDRGRTLAAEDLEIEALGSTRLSLFVAGEAEMPMGLEADPRRSRALRVAPEDLPESALAWAAVDRALLAGDAWDRLSTQQREALIGWVALGGHLLLAGGVNGQGLAAALPEALRPAEAGALRELERLPSLASLAGSAGPRGSARVIELSPVAGATTSLATREGLPLAVAKSYGDGASSFLAFDPTAAPFAGWTGMAAVWSALELPRPGSAWSEAQPDTAWMADGISTGRGLPPMGWALLILAGYIFLAGPASYTFLARKRRLDLAWLGIPLLAILTSALLYGAGRFLQDRAPQLHQLTALRVLPGPGLALSTSYVGLWSPAAKAQDLEIAAGLARPASDKGGGLGRLDVLLTPEGSRVRGLGLAQASLGGFAVDALEAWPAGDPSEPLRLADGRVEGRLTNPIGRDLEDGLLLTPGGRAVVGGLAAGQPTTVRARYMPGSPVELDARGARGHLLAALLADGMQASSPMVAAFQVRGFARPEAILTGFLDMSPLELSLESSRVEARAETLVYSYIPVGLGGGMVFVDGLATRRGPDSASACGPAGAVLTPEYAFAEFAFPLGEGQALPYAVWLALLGPGPELLAERGVTGARPPEVLVALWDPDTGRWLDFERLAAGASAQIPRLVTQVEGRNQIRIRLTRDDGAVGLRDWEFLRDACWEPRLSIVEGAPPDMPGEGSDG